MAEVLGLVSSLIAVIQLAGTVSALTYNYISKVKNAKKDIQELADEVCSFLGILTTLQVQIEHKNYDKTAIKSLDGPLKKCQQDLASLTTKLKIPSKKDSVLKSLSWPLKEKETKGEIIKIGRLKALFVLALSTDHITLTHATHAFLASIQSTVEETNAITTGIQKSTRYIADGVRELAVEQQKWQQAQIARQVSKEHHEVLRWLDKGIDPTINHNSACALREPDTGKWFSEAHHFREWVDTRTSLGKAQIGLIWLQGIPGAGKTVLTSTIIEQTKSTIGPFCGLAYFYFDFKDTAKQSAVNMLGNLVAQLCGQQDLSQPALSLYEAHRTKQGWADQAELISLFQSIVKGFPVAFIFLDAMDECQNRPDLTKIIKQIASISNVRLLLTSRPEQDLKEGLTGCQMYTISIQSDAVNDDVKLYVESAVKQYFHRQKPSTRHAIIETLVGRAQGMFRWASCQVELLRKVRTGSQILAKLSTLPKDLLETYERILLSIPEQDAEFARRILLCLVFSKRPLSIQELAEAMIVEIGSAELDDNLRLADPLDATATEELLQQIMSICGSLISAKEQRPDYSKLSRIQHKDADKEVNANGVVLGLAHFSVQEYLISTDIALGVAKYYALSDRAGNVEILEICVTYLQWYDFASGPCGSNVSFDKRIRNYPFYQYAAQNWYKHVVDDQMDAEVVAPSGMLPLERTEIFDSWLQANLTVRKDIYHAHRNWERTQCGIYFASKFGLTSSLANLLSCTTENHKQETNQAILVASAWGHAPILGLLLEYGADPGCADTYGNTPLHIAIDRCRIEAVRRLVNSKFHLRRILRARDRNGRTPLFKAMQLREYDIVKLLLEKGSNIYEEDGYRVTSLDLALELADPKLVEMMLSHSTSHTKSYLQNVLVSSEPLKQAARRGQTELVKLLLKHGFEVPGKTDLYWKIVLGDLDGFNSMLSDFKSQTIWKQVENLHLACRFGHLNIIKSIFDANGKAGANSTVRRERTALHYAALSGKAEVTKFVLDSGADIALVDVYNWTALHFALSVPLSLNLLVDDYSKRSRRASKGDLETVKTLLKHVPQVDIFAKTTTGKTALELAGIASECDPEIIRLLINAQLQRTEGIPAAEILHWVVQYEFSDILETLVQRGVNLNHANKHGQTLLHIAVGMKQERVVRTLLRNGASFVGDGDGSEPIHYAAQNDDASILGLLVNGGAEITATNNEKKSPLHYAALNRNLATMRLLIENNCDLLATDIRGMTALHHAVTAGNAAGVQLLLDHGAKLNAVNKDGDSALHLLMKSNGVPDHAVAKILLENRINTAMSNANRQSALHILAARPHPELIDLLVDHGADLELYDMNGQRALQIAAEHGWPLVAEHLLAHGADPVTSDKHSVTALHWAARGLRLSMVETLLRAGASSSSKDSRGRTPLHWVFLTTFLAKNRVLQAASVVARLLQHDAKPDTIDHNGRTPLFYALNNTSRDLEFWETIVRDVEGDADPAILLILAGADIDAVDNLGMSLLQASALRSDVRTTKLIVDNGADVALTTTSSESAIHFAVARPDLSVYYAHQIEIIEMLISAGVDVNAQDEHNMTALHWVVTESWINFSPEIVEVLLSCGADLEVVNREGRTAYDLAVEFRAEKAMSLMTGKSARKTEGKGGSEGGLTVWKREREKRMKDFLQSITDAKER